MNDIAMELVIILLLLATNGVLAMTEIAVVSARKARLRCMAEDGDERARAALALAESPNQFLATVQVGITLVGVLAGAFGGATIAEQIAQRVERAPALAPYGEAIGIGVVVLGITYLSLVIGELVPKRIGLNNPVRIARIMARPMRLLAAVTRPLVAVLSLSTEVVLRLLRMTKHAEPPVTEDEVRGMVEEGVEAGVFDRREPDMVEGVLALDRLAVRDIMTPRAKMIWIKQSDPHEIIWHKIVVGGHSYYPVYEHSRDQVAGIVSLKAMYAHLAAGIPVRVRDLLVPPLFVDGGQSAAAALETFKRTGQHIAIVTHGEGRIIGIVGPLDIMEAIVGEFPSPGSRLRPQARVRSDGSWLVDGSLAVEDMTAALPRLQFPPAEQRDYATMGQFAAIRIGRPPHEGDTFDDQGLRFEIVDTDGMRVDKLMVTPLDSGSVLLTPGEAPRPGGDKPGT